MDNFSDLTNLPPLTQRELQVLSEARFHASYVSIGQQLSISQHTVRAHIVNIRRKWQLQSLPGVVAIAERLQLFAELPTES